MKLSSPVKVLSILTAVNYLNYIDRYILAAVLVSIKADLGLSDFQAGLLATAFMIPYMFTAPLFGWLGDTRDRSKILSLGAGLWSLATLVTGMAGHFWTMMASRFTLGIGESAFTTTSIPLLSEYFPSAKRGRVLAIFSSALPVGAALGYVLGGILGASVGWRWAFAIVGFPGLILAAIVWFIGDPRKENIETKFAFGSLIQLLGRSKSYVWAVAGYCAYTFAVGGIAHWIPSYIQRTYSLSELSANTLFGGIAVGSGLVGTLLGGYLGDHLSKKERGGHLKISAISMFFAIPAFWFCMHAETVKSFAILLVFVQLFFFLSTSPINVALLESVPEKFRNSGMAMAIFLCHVLGDAISSPLIGKVSDVSGSLQSGILLCAPVIFLSAIFWWLGSRVKEART
jgi:MFS transporter, Spinster family, sphingosine-1-phosphate transporter